MNVKQLSRHFAVAEQITASDIKAIADAGFRSIVCARPDGEGGPTQPTFSAIASAATTHGLEAAHVPVVPGQMTAADVEKFDQAIRALPGPVLGYCRSGARAAGLWQAAGAA